VKRKINPTKKRRGKRTGSAGSPHLGHSGKRQHSHHEKDRRRLHWCFIVWECLLFLLDTVLIPPPTTDSPILEQRIGESHAHNASIDNSIQTTPPPTLEYNTCCCFVNSVHTPITHCMREEIINSSPLQALSIHSSPIVFSLGRSKPVCRNMGCILPSYRSSRT
jgi:hypothetical protein